MQFAANRFDRQLRAAGCRFTDHFTGFEITGRMRTPELARVLQHLPNGLTELMCHPGFLGDELRAAPTRLKESRLRELEALTSPEIRQLIAAGGIQLTRYRDL